MEYKRYIPIPLKFFYNSRSRLWGNLVNSTLQFSYDLMLRSERFRVLPIFEKGFPAIKMNFEYWQSPEMYHPVLSELDSTGNAVVAEIGKRKNIKIAKKTEGNRHRIKVLHPADDAVPSRSKKMADDNPEENSFSHWKKTVNIVPKTVELERVSETSPAVQDFPEIEEKINYRIWRKSLVAQPDNSIPSKNDTTTDALNLLTSVKAFQTGKLTGKGINRLSGIYKKRTYFPFLVVPGGFPAESIFTAKPGEKREFPPVEMMHKPDLIPVQTDNQRVYRDPANPYRYQIRESLIPSLKQFSSTETTDPSPSGYRKTFHFARAKVPEYLQMNKIFSESGTDALSNLVKFNYFRDEFFQEIKERIVTDKLRDNKNPKTSTGQIKRHQQFRGKAAEPENRSGQLRSFSLLHRIKNVFKITPVFGKSERSSNRFLEEEHHKFSDRSVSEYIPPFKNATLNNMLTRHYRNFTIPERIINEAENSLEFKGISTTSFHGDTWIYQQAASVGYKNKKIRQGIRDKVRRLLKLKSDNEKYAVQTIPGAVDTVPPVGEVATGDVIIPVESSVKSEPSIENLSAKNSKTFYPHLEEAPFVENWIHASNKTSDPNNLKISELSSGRLQSRYITNSSGESFTASVPGRMAKFSDYHKLHLNPADKKQELELFFKQYAPEAFPEMDDDEKISGGRKADFLNDQEEGSELEYENRQRLLIELSERIWEHIKKKIKQR